MCVYTVASCINVIFTTTTLSIARYATPLCQWSAQSCDSLHQHRLGWKWFLQHCQLQLRSQLPAVGLSKMLRPGLTTVSKGQPKRRLYSTTSKKLETCLQRLRQNSEAKAS